MDYFYNKRQVHIITTSRCNLRCKYCYEMIKGAVDTDVNKMKLALENDISNHSDCEYLITFHGGEPLLCFNIINEISEWLWATFPSTPITIGLTTNGTIINDEIRQWIYKNHTKAIVSLSIDGLPEVHDRNRCGSFHKIDMNFFKHVYKKPVVKMTVPADEIKHLFNGFCYLYEEGFMPEVALAVESDFTESQISTLTTELLKLADFYTTHFDLPITEFLNFPFERLSPNVKKGEYLHRCGIGESRIAFDTNGNPYPCQTFITDFSKAYDTNEVNRIYESLSKPWQQLFPQCLKCSIGELCSPCYGINYSYRGEINYLNPNMCATTLMVIQAAAKIWTQTLLNRDKYQWLQNIDNTTLNNRLLGLREYYARSK